MVINGMKVDAVIFPQDMLWNSIVVYGDPQVGQYMLNLENMTRFVVVLPLKECPDICGPTEVRSSQRFGVAVYDYAYDGVVIVSNIQIA